LIGLLKRPLRDDTQHSQEEDNHARGGIRTGSPCKQATADRAATRTDRSCKYKSTDSSQVVLCTLMFDVVANCELCLENVRIEVDPLRSEDAESQ
jgi:hypothetical protein